MPWLWQNLRRAEWTTQTQEICMRKTRKRANLQGTNIFRTCLQRRAPPSDWRWGKETTTRMGPIHRRIIRTRTDTWQNQGNQDNQKHRRAKKEHYATKQKQRPGTVQNAKKAPRWEKQGEQQQRMQQRTPRQKRNIKKRMNNYYSTVPSRAEMTSV